MTYFVIAIVVLAALAAVIVPLVRRAPADASRLDDDAALESRIAGYREALKANTVCDRCLRDNPSDSKFCADCGSALTRGRA